MPTRDHAVDALFASIVGFGRALRTQSHAGTTVHPELTRPELATLGVIATCGPCRSSALAEHLGVGASVVSRQLAHFAELGLVRRDSDPADGRAELISLTEAGRRRRDEGIAAYRARLTERLADWDDDRVREAARLLDELAALLAPPRGARPRGAQAPAEAPVEAPAEAPVATP